MKVVFQMMNLMLCLYKILDFKSLTNNGRLYVYKEYMSIYI